MKTKRITALFLIASMTFSIASCSKGKGEDFAGILEDMGYEQLDEYDEDDIEDEMEDGFFLITEDRKDIGDILDIEGLGDIMDIKARDLSSAFLGARLCDGGMYQVYQFDFEDADTAEEAFENMADNQLDGAEEARSYYDRDHFNYDEGDDYFTYAFSSSSIKYGDIWLDGNVINFIYGKFYYTNDAYDDFVDLFEAIDRDLPEELIKDRLTTQREHDDQIAAIVEEIDDAMEG